MESSKMNKYLKMVNMGPLKVNSHIFVKVTLDFQTNYSPHFSLNLKASHLFSPPRYGFSNMRYIASLISGVGIFMMGAGLSWYHGIMGLLHPQPIESLLWVSFVFCVDSCVRAERNKWQQRLNM